jgi:hypothetical protein
MTRAPAHATRICSPMAWLEASQAEVRLVADETDKASTEEIKTDQQRVEAAQEVEAAEAKTSSVDFVT